MDVCCGSMEYKSDENTKSLSIGGTIGITYLGFWRLDSMIFSKS